MILFGNSFSPFVRKVLVYAAEKAIALDNQQTGRPPDYDPRFLAASPMRLMPALVDGDFSVADSTAIITYLEALHPTPALIPTDPRRRARAIWFEEFADTMMSKVVFKVFFNRVVAPVFMGKPGDAAAAQEGEHKDLPPLLDYLESVVPTAGEFLVGDQLSIADIAVASMFVNYHHANIEIDAARYPRITTWAAMILARPSFAPMIAAEKTLLARLNARRDQPQVG